MRERGEDLPKRATRSEYGVSLYGVFMNRRRLKDRQSSNSRNYCMSLSIRDYSIGGRATALDDGVGKDPLISSL